MGDGKRKKKININKKISFKKKDTKTPMVKMEEHIFIEEKPGRIDIAEDNSQIISMELTQMNDTFCSKSPR
jgi:hypothetical protein